MAEDSPKTGEGNQTVQAEMPHRMARTPFGKIVLGSLGAAALLAICIPLGLYELGLANIQGRPTPSIQTKDIAADSALLQQTFRSKAPVHVRVLNPWSFAGELQDERAVAPDNGSRAVWIVVGHYNASHLENHAMMWWHLSGTALMVWVTRNWATEEIVTAAAAIIRMQPKEPAPIQSEQAIEIRLSSSLNSCFVVGTEVPCSDIGVRGLASWSREVFGTRQSAVSMVIAGRGQSGHSTCRSAFRVTDLHHASTVHIVSSGPL